MLPWPWSFNTSGLHTVAPTYLRTYVSTYLCMHTSVLSYLFPLTSSRTPPTSVPQCFCVPLPPRVCANVPLGFQNFALVRLPVSRARGFIPALLCASASLLLCTFLPSHLYSYWSMRLRAHAFFAHLYS